MGLTSSKEAKDVTITAADVGVVRISEEALNNIKDIIETETSKSETKVEESKPAIIQKERAPTENEAALAARLDEYEKKMIHNFKNATKDVEEMFRDRYKTLPVCLDLQQLVKNCYNENQKYPLKCLDISEKYIKCIENERLNRFKAPSSGP